MIRVRFLMSAAILVGVAVLGIPTQAHAAFNLILRATEYDSTGAFESSSSATKTSSASAFNLTSDLSTTDFSINVVSTTVNTAGLSTSHSTTINITYVGPVSPSDKLIIEVLGSNYVAPPPSLSFVTSNASPSTSGLLASSVTMTSAVINTNPTVLGSNATFAGTPLAGQSGQTSGSGTMGGASSILSPNPVTGPNFSLANAFAFYQTFQFSGFSPSGLSGSISSGTTVTNTPAPAGFLLAFTGLPILAGFRWLRGRKPVQMA